MLNVIYKNKNRISDNSDRIAEGQSLIEAIIATAVISVALLGFLSQATAVKLAGRESFERDIAVNLAREGVEVVKNIRDSKWLAGCYEPADDCWRLGENNLKPGDYVVMFFYGDKKWYLFPPPNIEDFRIVRHIEDNYYSHPIGMVWGDYDETGYSRVITIEQICADGSASCSPDDQIGINVASKVTWTNSDNEREAILAEKLYNWEI